MQCREALACQLVEASAANISQRGAQLTAIVRPDGPDLHGPMIMPAPLAQNPSKAHAAMPTVPAEHAHRQRRGHADEP